MVIQVEVVVYIRGIRDHLLVVVVDQKIMLVIKLIHILINDNNINSGNGYVIITKQ